MIILNDCHLVKHIPYQFIGKDKSMNVIVKHTKGIHACSVNHRLKQLV